MKMTREYWRVDDILWQGTAEDPRAPLAGNLRPTQVNYPSVSKYSFTPLKPLLQPTNGRLIRTNIDFDHNKVYGQ